MRIDFDPSQYLKALQDQKDTEIDLGQAAIALAALQQPDISTQRYIHHLKIMAEDVKQRYVSLLESGAQDDVGTRLAALKYAIGEYHHYIQDLNEPDHIDNANIMRVIDRAKGAPVALCVLYIAAARAQGWTIEGLQFPSYFLCRLEKGGARLIFDPSQDCQVLEAHDVRQLLKERLGHEAELSAEYFEPKANREILIALQNKIKYKKIALEDYEGALEIVQAMQVIAPDEYRLLLDAGVLYARLDHKNAAIQALEGYIGQAPYNHDRHEAELLLYELRRALN